jgi:hypothetical protein
MVEIHDRRTASRCSQVIPVTSRRPRQHRKDAPLSDRRGHIVIECSSSVDVLSLLPQQIFSVVFDDRVVSGVTDDRGGGR